MASADRPAVVDESTPPVSPSGLEPTEHAKMARKTLILLTVLNFFNYVDRQGVYALFPLIKKEFALTDGQLGMIGTACLLVLSLAAVPGGWLADRIGARIVITAGAVAWSLATAASGLARSFHQLLVARACVGVGEAAYEPAANASLCALYPERKSEVLAQFNVGTALGIACGMAFASVLGSSLGWRTTILIMAVPGFLLAPFAWRQLGSLPRPEMENRPKARELFSVASPTLILMIVAGTLASFAAGALVAWMPTFVMRYHRWGLAEGGLILGAMSILCGAAGVVAGGYLSDRVERWRPGGRTIAVAIAFLISGPLGVASTFVENRQIFVVTCGLTIFAMAFYGAPIIAIIDDVVPRRFAATAQASFLFISHLLGDTIAPAVVGRLADYVGGPGGLRKAVLIAVVASTLAGVAFAGAAFRYVKDRDRARGL